MSNKSGIAATVSAPVDQLEDWFAGAVKQPAEHALGGPARLRVIAILACVLGLDSADKAAVGALAVELKEDLSIGNMEVAFLVAGATLVTALAALPFGALTDRVNRSRLLAGSIVAWAVFMIVGGFANSFVMLLISRLALGAAIGAAVPTVASLIGDYFQPGERGRIWGYILAGELAGVAVGYMVAGNIAALWSWRFSFWALGVISLVLAPVTWCLLPEPARGGQSWIPPGARKVPGAEESGRRKASNTSIPKEGSEIEEAVDERGFRSHKSQVLRKDPARLSFWQAARYILSIRTNLILISASALGYFFLGAVITFGIVYMRNRFGLGQAAATSLSVGLGAGAIFGVLITGHLADRWIARGRIGARIAVAGGAFLIAAALFVPALLTTSIYLAAPLFFIAAAALGGANPPLDAARLDIMHFHLWGRAESLRAVLRFVFQAFGPMAFAAIFILLGTGGDFLGVAAGNIEESADALARAFFVLLIPLAAAGVILLMALGTYPRDVATARASEHATHGGH